MATAAPAAPSTSAQPTAQPLPGAGLDGPAATPVPAPETAPRLARPAKPIPSLPGVFPDDDPFPSPPSSKSAATSDSPRASTSATRGPDGRFLAGPSPAETDVGEHTLEAVDAPPPTAARFKFGGEEFASQSEAEQNFKSLRGQFRPIQQLAKSLGGVDKIIPSYSTAAESARGWKGEHEKVSTELATVRAELAALRSGRPATATAPGPDAPAAEAADVDWDLYAEVKKLATDSGEPWKAEQWLIEQVRAADRAHYTKVLDDRFKPLADQDAQQAVHDQTEGLFSNLAEYTNSDGTPAFPELHDERPAYEVGKLWASLGLPAEAAMTPQGAIAAIAIHRMAKNQPRSQAGPAAVAATTAPTPALPTDAHIAAALDGGRSMRVSAPGGDAPSADAARIMAALRATNSGNRAVLGFDA